jgi:hypothetical protein
MKLLLGIVAALGLISSPFLAAADKKVEGDAPKKANDQRLVMEVNEVTISKNGNAVTITAKGQVNTGGWNRPALLPYVYAAPPADGVYTFEFVAQAPGGMSTQVISPIEVRYTWSEFPATAKSIRIISASNEVIKPLAEDAKAPGK